MKKFPSMTKLEFMMAVEQMGGWPAVEVHGNDADQGKAYVRRFNNHWDYGQFLEWKNWSPSGIESVELRTQRAPKKKRRAATDARAGRW